MITCIEKRNDGICLYEMKNDDLHVLVSSYGVTILSIEAKDRDGKFENVVLGHPAIDDYMKKDGYYFGAVVGRVCNRLAKGEFTLDGVEYHVPINNGPNSLHGGIDGFSYKNFDSKIEGDSLVFTYTSKDMEEGYPGNLKLTVTLELKGNSLEITYDAITDKKTLCNLTHHTYFNLNGQECDVKDHLMHINASRHGLVDKDGLCTGHFREVYGTPLDFTKEAPVSQGLNLNDEQTENAYGIDHHFVLDDEDDQFTLYDPKTGRLLTVNTTFPGMQIYSGNYIGKCEGINGKSYDQHWGVAVEPQYLPDSIHNQEQPDAILRPGEQLHETITYTFDIR